MMLKVTVTLKDVGISELDPGRFQAVLDPDSCRRFLDRLAQAAERLDGRRLWQVNSTEQGGGVAEMLHFLLGYLTGAGIDARWVVMEGNDEFVAMASPARGLPRRRVPIRYRLAAGMANQTTWRSSSRGSAQSQYSGATSTRM
jgi:hypothetical protein